MAASAVEILRQQLRDQFPQAHGLRTSPAPSPLLEKPFSVDSFPIGAISEVLPAGPSAGLALFMAGLLDESESANSLPQLVLIDGADAFDPNSFPGDACSKLVWVRCASALEMLKAADLLVHDGNMPFVLLDSTGVKRQDLNALPAAAWWRMKQAVERTGLRLVVLATSPLVPCASLRVSLSAGLSLADFDRAQAELLPRVQASSNQLRRAT